MSTGKKPVLIFMIIILAGQLLGEIKSAAGELLIPTAKGKEKPYRGIITITGTEILIECREKVFQLFNEPDAPKQAKIRMNTAEVERITLLRNGVVIFPKDPLYNRYRNLLNRVWLISIGKVLEKLVFIFIFDSDIKSIGSNEKKLIDIINKRNDPRGRLRGFIRPY